MKISSPLLFLFGLAAQLAVAQPVRVAVATEARPLIEALQRTFETRHSHRLELIVGTADWLTQQVQRGALFEVFVSDNTRHPGELAQDGFAQEAPRTYAHAELVLWTSTNLPLDTGLAILRLPAVATIALAEPATVPVGAAAASALAHYQLTDATQTKLLPCQTVAQVSERVLSGEATVGFVPRSAVAAAGRRGRWVPINRRAYRPLAQSAVLMRQPRPAARTFYDFLFTPPAQAIVQRLGYLNQAGK